MRRHIFVSAFVLAMLAELQACGDRDSPAEPQLPALVVHKNASSGCCGEWVKHMRLAGFPVRFDNIDNLGPIKERVGIPAAMGSCRTAEIGGYFVEGHLPAEDVRRLLIERPNAKGLTVPGTPIGSLGMEVASRKAQPYDVYLVANDGSVSVFAHHGEVSAAQER